MGIKNLTFRTYFGYQPILNRRQNIVGFELLFRGIDQNNGVVLDQAQVTSQVLTAAFASINANEFLQRRKAFINVDREILESTIIELFPPGKIVLEILETTQPDSKLIEKCKMLRKKGYLIALDDFRYSEPWKPLLQIVNFVKLDIHMLNPEELKQHVDFLRHYDLYLIAEKVETPEEAKFCRALGFDYFQGYYFARPAIVEVKDLHPSKQIIILLLSEIMRGTEVQTIEDILKRDTGLSYRVLCYINSASMGLASRITSLRHALVILGRERLWRWLTLMLFTERNNRILSGLANTAIVRGRLMELLGLHSNLIHPEDHEKANQMFITGMFSLLDALLEVPMDVAIQKLKLPKPVVEALIGRSGPYGPYLSLVEAIEQNDTKKIASLEEALQLNSDDVNLLLLEAMAWAENITLY